MSPRSASAGLRPRPLVLAGAAALLLVLLAGAVGAAVGLTRSQGGAGGPVGGPAPANDTFLTAQPIAGEQFTGSLADATGDAAEVAAGVVAPGAAAVWYRWTPTLDGWAYITPTTVGGDPGAQQVRVFTGDQLAVLQRVDQPSGGPPPAPGDGPEASVPVVAGTTYGIAVIGTPPAPPASATTFDLRIFQPDGGTRPNDAPAGALDLAVPANQSAAASGAVTEAALDTLGGATAQAGEPAVGGQPAARSVWFTWTVPNGGGSLALAAQPAFGAPAGGADALRLAAYTGSGNDPAAFAPIGGGGPSLTVSGTGGERFLVSLDGPASFFRLTVAASGVAAQDTTPPAVACAAASPTFSTAEVVGVACTATDGGSGLADPADAAFTLEGQFDEGTETTEGTTAARSICDQAGNCSPAGPVEGLRVDRKGPVVNCDPPLSSWSGANPTIVCVATDQGSGLADAAQANASLTTDVAAGEERAASIAAHDVCDVAGNCTPVAAIGPINVDRKGPVVTCDPAPAAIQTSGEVTINCTAEDEGSGLGDPTTDAFTLVTDVGEGAADLAAATSARSVCDVTGNCTDAGPITGIKIDRAPPSVDCDVPEGWQKNDVTVRCAVADIGSGLAPGTPAVLELTATLPAGQESDRVETTSAQVCDAAGSCVTAGPFTVAIDHRAPVVTCAVVPEEWTKGPSVTIDCGVQEQGSGLADPSQQVVRLTATQPAGAEGPVATNAVDVCDTAGNCAPAGAVTGIRIDAKAPVVTCAAPTGGAGTEAKVACTATDGGSGVAGPSTFELVTSVGDGQANASAPTDEREVCDVAANCTNVGPFSAPVDRATPITGQAPHLPVPSKVTVIGAVDPAGPVPAPYRIPPSAPGVTVTCAPGTGTTMAPGWTVIVCESLDASGHRVTDSFPIVVKPVPALAAHGPAVRGGAWRSVGIGFGAGSGVQLELDGAPIATGSAGGDGRAVVAFTVPDTLSPGRHLLALHGADADGQPVIVVSFVDVVVATDGQQPPTSPPDSAPTLPPSGPAVPPDPEPRPSQPIFERSAVPTTTTTTPTGPTTTTTSPSNPGSSTTTAPTNQTTTTGNPEGATTTIAGSGDGGTGTSGGSTSAGATDAAPPTSTTTTGALPLTGGAVGGLVLLAAALIVVGILLKRRARDTDPAP
jgi:hypothetical protein